MATITREQPLVLGSGSPRRREILTQIDIPFVVESASADEDLRPGEDVGAYLPRVVRAKLEAVLAKGGARVHAAPCILVADTTVVDLGDRASPYRDGHGAAILGKPGNAAEAEEMIVRLAGKTHEVHTRFLVASGDRVRHEETVITRVTFRALQGDEARLYALSGEGMDKAGGYAVQGRASAFVSRIEGSYTNVVGLPACQVRVALMGLALV